MINTISRLESNVPTLTTYGFILDFFITSTVVDKGDSNIKQQVDTKQDEIIPDVIITILAVARDSLRVSI